MASTAPIPADAAVSPKYAAFDLIDVNYKEVNGVSIPASVLIPKSNKSGKHPVIVRWHGGCLITGHRLFLEWFPAWVLELAVSKDAIIVTPDYRLMPEVSGLEILDDVRDFYSWLSGLDSYLPDGVSADTNNILVVGESAGGWLSLQSALLATSRDKVAAIIAQYPMIDMRDRYYTEDYEKQIFNPPVPPLDPSILKDYVESMESGKTIPSAMPPDRFGLVNSSLQQGVYGKWLGSDSSLYPIEVLEKMNDLAPVWLLHGKYDSVIPAEGSYKFEKAVKEKLPEANLHVTYVEGDHGFDNAEGIGLKTDWVKEGVLFIDKYWPKV